jgi:hypothetical protein
MADETGDPQVRIAATIDPSGAISGAGKTVDAIDGIKGSSEGASSAGKNLVDQFGSLRSAHHALAAIGEIARGGTEAVAGEAMAVRFLGEAFESLIPGGAALVALATVVSLGASMVARQQEHNDKLADGKDKTDALKDATDHLNESVTAYQQAADAALTALSKGEKDQEDAFSAANKTYEVRVGLLQKEIGLRQQLADVLMATAEAGELRANTDGAEGALKITEKYDSLKEGYKERFDFEKLNLERQQLAVQNQDLGDRYAAEKAYRDKLQTDFDSLTAQLASAKDNAQSLGIPVSTDDKSYTKVAAGGIDSISEMEAQQDALREKMETGNESGYETSDVITKELADLQTKITETTHRVSAAMDLARAQAAMKSVGEKTRVDLDESNRKLSGYSSEERDNTQKLIDKDAELQIARLNARKTAGDLAAKDKKDQAELADRDAKARNEAAQEVQSQIEKDKTQTPTARAAAALAGGDLKATALQREYDEGTAKGSDKLTKGEAAKLKEDILAAKQEAQVRAKQITDEAAKAAAEAQKKAGTTDKKDLSDVSRQVEDFLKNDGASREMTDNAHAAEEEMSQGHVEGAERLLDAFEAHVQATKNMTAAQQTLASQLIAKLQETIAIMEGHTGMINDLSNSVNN